METFVIVKDYTGDHEINAWLEDNIGELFKFWSWKLIDGCWGISFEECVAKEDIVMFKLMFT